MARDYETYRDKVELAKACLVGLCANFEAPHHRARELVAKALDAAQAFYDELDAREAANEAKEAEEAEAGPTEPPPATDPVPSEPEPESQPHNPRPEPVNTSDEPNIDRPHSTTERVSADRPWNGGDLARG